LTTGIEPIRDGPGVIYVPGRRQRDDEPDPVWDALWTLSGDAAACLPAAQSLYKRAFGEQVRAARLAVEHPGTTAAVGYSWGAWCLMAVMAEWGEVKKPLLLVNPPTGATHGANVLAGGLGFLPSRSRRIRSAFKLDSPDPAEIVHPERARFVFCADDRAHHSEACRNKLGRTFTTAVAMEGGHHLQSEEAGRLLDGELKRLLVDPDG